MWRWGMAAVWVAACDGGGKGGVDDTDATEDTDGVDDTDAAVASVTFSEWCEAAAEAYRAHLADCLDNDGYSPTGGFADMVAEGCLQSADSVASGRMSFNGVQGAACLDAIEGRACAWRFDPFYLPACQGMFAGAVPLGGECYAWAGVSAVIGVGECAEGYCSDDTCPGACEPWLPVGADCVTDAGDWLPCDPATSQCDGSVCAPRAEVGQPCPAGACEDGAACLDVEGVMTCVAVARYGDTCSDELPCHPPIFRCADDGVCRIEVDRGDPCVLQDNCAEGDVCRDADGDGPAGRTCELPAEDGADCLDATDCDSGWCVVTVGPWGVCSERLGRDTRCTSTGECALGLWCQFDGDGQGSCQPAGADGESCTSYGFPALEPGACADGLRCMVDGACHPSPGGEGDHCHPFLYDSCAGGLTCDRSGGTCELPASDGEACTPGYPDACATGLGCACVAQDESCFMGVSVEPQPFHRCRPLVADEGACWFHEECASGNCDRSAAPEGTDAGVCRTWVEAPLCVGP